MKLKKHVRNFFKYYFLKRGYRIQSVYRFNFLDSLLYQYLRKYKKINFIQIGANDGKRFDPIHEFIIINKHDVSGLVLEPVNNYYTNLCETYKNYPRIKPMNLAIHNTLKETSIYKIGKEFEEKVPEFALGVASFNNKHHLRTNIPSKYIVEEKVNCISLNKLFETNSIEKLSLLVIDTEGYDYEILTNINFDILSPDILHFEHGLKSGTMSVNQFKEVKKLLKTNKYQLFIEEANATAYKSDILLAPLSM
jgi:FkbM family methyltransferase